MILACPRCSIPHAQSTEKSAILDSTCVKCGYAYRFAFGVVEKRSTRQITLQRESKNHPGSYQREYEFRLRLPNGELETFPFAVPGRDDWILARKGDEVSFVYTLNNGAIEELLAIENETTGQKYTISKAGSRAQKTALLVAGTLSCLSLIVTWISSGSPTFAIVAATVSAIGGYALILANHASSSKRKLSPEARETLNRRQALLEQKQSLLLLAAPCFQDFERHGKLLDSMQELREKMISVGAELYRARIEKLDAALSILLQQLALDRELVEGYGRAIQMLEIEIDSQTTTDAVPSSIVDTISAKTQELLSVRQRNQELEIALLANEEVEQVLKSE